MSAALDIKSRVEAWRKHPNYGKVCKCGHHAVLHVDGEKECECGCRSFVAREVAA